MNRIWKLLSSWNWIAKPRRRRRGSTEMSDLLMCTVGGLVLLILALVAVVRTQADQINDGRDLEVAFVVDGSTSMRQSIDQLIDAAEHCVELFPWARTFRVAVVITQNGKYHEFRLREIKKEADDGGISRKAVRDVLSSVEVKSGLVDVSEATQRAMSLLGERRDSDGMQVICLLSDVAVGDVLGVDEEANDEFVRSISDWLEMGTGHRRFLALFAPSPDYHYPSYDPAEHRDIYERIGGLRGGRFEDSAGAMFHVLFETMFSGASWED